MYMECKAGGIVGKARIGRVTFSRAGKSIYYNGRTFKTMKGTGFKANYRDIETGEEYWISGPKKNGQDRLYGERLPIEIDDDAREEYWVTIREEPENKNKTRIW
jgi:hypothetical protein